MAMGAKRNNPVQDSILGIRIIPSVSAAASASGLTFPTTFSPSNVVSNTAYKTPDDLIQGKMFVAQSTISQYEFEQFPAGEIKRKMILQLAEVMLNQDCIEFTTMKEPNAMDQVKVRARVFVTPDSQVRLLREKGY